MSDVIAEERTTLPEGATLSISRVTRPKLGPCNELRAWRDNNIVKMRADDITPQNLRWYLDRVIAEINRERAKLTNKPGMLFRNPKNIRDFVNNMAFFGMFILEATQITVISDEPKTIDEHIADEKPKGARKARRRRKKEKAVTVPANGTHAI